MLYLAQVQTHVPAQAAIGVVMLAHQEESGKWTVPTPSEMTLTMPSDLAQTQWHKGMLVIVRLDAEAKCTEIQDAIPFVLQLFASNELSSTLEDVHEIEQWRQELTLKSQEMSMKMLELATRRERLGVEETDLAMRQKQLEVAEAELNQQQQQFATQQMAAAKPASPD